VRSILDPIAIRRRERPSLTGGTIVEFLADVPLTCPYFHQRFLAPDGGFFLCGGDFDGVTELVRIDLETGAGFRLTAGGAHAHTGDLHQDGRHFAFTSDGLYQVDVLSGEVCRRRPFPDEGWEFGGCVHTNSDCTCAALFANRQHESGVPVGSVWTVSNTDGGWRRVVSRPFRIGHVQFSPTDPELLMYCHETGGASPQRMWLARTDGDHPGPLYHRPGHPWVTHEVFSGDGQWVVFIRHPEGLGMIGPDNTGLRTVDAPGAWHPGPSFDAGRICYDTHDGRLCMWDATTGRHTALSSWERSGDAPHLHPRFCPDDVTVIWTSTYDGPPHPALLRL
jgi:hypothetical protein